MLKLPSQLPRRSSRLLPAAAAIRGPGQLLPRPRRRRRALRAARGPQSELAASVRAGAAPQNSQLRRRLLPAEESVSYTTKLLPSSLAAFFANGANVMPCSVQDDELGVRQSGDIKVASVVSVQEDPKKQSSTLGGHLEGGTV